MRLGEAGHACGIKRQALGIASGRGQLENPLPYRRGETSALKACLEDGKARGFHTPAPLPCVAASGQRTRRGRWIGKGNWEYLKQDDGRGFSLPAKDGN